MPEYRFSAAQARDVYLPDEDTYLLMDALLAVVEPANIPAVSFLEIGPGSGVVSTFAGLSFKPAEQWAVDVNPAAVQMTKETLALNGVCGARVVQGDLFGPFEGGKTFQIIAFNPPYCVGDATEIGVIDRALSGGANGRREIDRFVLALPDRLDVGGVAVMICIESNGIDEIRGLAGSLGLRTELIEGKRLPTEKLFAMVFRRQDKEELAKDAHETRHDDHAVEK